MSDFLIRSNINPRISIPAASAASAAPAPRASTVFVDVAQTPTRADISRGGFALGEVAVNPGLIASFLDDLQVVQTKVVTQAVLPGTAVARGTAIDIVLANPSNVPVHVVPGIHNAFQELTMAQLNTQFADNTVVRDIVRHTTSPDDLTTAQRESLTTAFQASGLTFDAQNTVDSAFTGVQAAFTLMG